MASKFCDGWACKAHFTKQETIRIVNDGDALDLCPDCFEAFTESGKHRDRCEYCDGSGGVDSGGSSLRGYYSIDIACPECAGLGFIDT